VKGADCNNPVSEQSFKGGRVYRDDQQKQKNIVVPVEVDGYGKTNNLRIDSNALTSLFGKNNAAKQLKDAIETLSTAKGTVLLGQK
jgi:hypothetical protein